MTTSQTHRHPLRGTFLFTCLAGLVAVAASPVAASPASAQVAATEASSAPAFGCQATEVVGVPAVDAATSVSIVCAELNRVSKRQGSYGVSIRPLGESFVLSVTRLPNGETRTLTLRGLAETPLAATRLAEALVLEQPIEKTQRVDNLLVEEARQPHEKKGSRKFMLGVTGLSANGRSGTGFSIGWVHEAPLWAVLGDLRWAGSSDGDRDVSFFSIGAGARRYVSRKDFAPFVGAGLETLTLSSDWYGGTSLAPYVEVGAQAMRLSRARITASIRAHVPTSSIEGDSYPQCTYDAYNYGGNYGCGGPPQHMSKYVVPITFDLTVSF